MEVRHLYHLKKELKWSIVPNRQKCQNRPTQKKKHLLLIKCLTALSTLVLPHTRKLTLQNSVWLPPKTREEKKELSNFHELKKKIPIRRLKNRAEFVIVS